MGKLANLNLTYEELDQLATQNPSLYSFMLGYAAEHKFLNNILPSYNIHDSRKPNDHDRTDHGDRVFEWNNLPIRVEIKSLQTSTLKPSQTPNIQKATVQIDASDKRTITLPNGHTIQTTCLQTGSFDILAVNMWAMFKEWKFAYCLNTNLPRTKSKHYTKEDQQYLLATSMTLRQDLQGTPFTWNLQELLEQIKPHTTPMRKTN